MKRLLVALAMAGCGGAHEETIDGDWISQVNDACAILASFDTKAGTYVHGFACMLANGGGGIDIESGAADFSMPGRVGLIPKSASCPAADHSPEVDGYTVAAGSLTIAMASGGLSFVRLKGGMPASVQAQFGCWTMGQFTASPIAPL